MEHKFATRNHAEICYFLEYLILRGALERINPAFGIGSVHVSGEQWRPSGKKSRLEGGALRGASDYRKRRWERQRLAGSFPNSNNCALRAIVEKNIA